MYPHSKSRFRDIVQKGEVLVNKARRVAVIYFNRYPGSTQAFECVLCVRRCHTHTSMQMHSEDRPNVKVTSSHSYIKFLGVTQAFSWFHNSVDRQTRQQIGCWLLVIISLMLQVDWPPLRSSWMFVCSGGLLFLNIAISCYKYICCCFIFNSVFATKNLFNTCNEYKSRSHNQF